MELLEETLEAVKLHARKEYPKEACGLILKDLSYIACENIADDPLVEFLIHEDVTAKYIDRLAAVMHTHTTTRIVKKSSPSRVDMEGQIATGIPWGICDVDDETVTDPYWISDSVLETPLYSQPFQHGIMDCYTAIRKWYYQKRGIKLKEFPRDESWWDNANLYLDNFSSAGFKQIGLDELEDGDVVLGSINSDIVNHGGIYLSNTEDGIGLIYHHLPNRLSRREPASPWVSRAQIGLRHVN